MNINIDYDTLIEANITLSEYVYLKSLYNKENDTKIFKIIDRIEEDILQTKGFIKITSGDIILRNKAIKLFEGDDLFLKFLNTFPIKTPTGRYLSPLGNTGIVASKVKKKWNTLFKNKPHLQKKAIAVLEAELTWRRQTGQMEYIKAIDAWLNDAHYEKFEYLLNKDINQIEDLM